MNGNDDEFYLFSNVVIKESQIGNTSESNNTSSNTNSESLSGNPLITSNKMNTSLIIHSKEEKQHIGDDKEEIDESNSNNLEDNKISIENTQNSSKKKNKKKKNKKKNKSNELVKKDEEEIETEDVETVDAEESGKIKRKLETDLTETTETTNAKKKRKKNKKNKNKQKTEEEEKKEDGEKEINEEDKGEENSEEGVVENTNKIKKSNIKIIKNNRQVSFFVGQIPYDCKEDQIRKHFEKNGIEVKDIRMLCKDDGSFKGCCFLHVPALQKEKTAKLHHSFLNNRQINVTLDPKSLGLTSKTSKEIMKTTIKKIRNDADKTTEEIMSETLQNIMNKANGSVTANDIDKKSLTALCSLPNNLSERLINDFSRLNFAGVKNINAYLMGMIKKYRTKYIPLSKK